MVSVDTQRSEAYPVDAAAIGTCDYCGKRRPVARLDNRAYVACSSCATDIRCFQAVTDEEAVGVEIEDEPRRRRRRRPQDLAEERHEWLSPPGPAVDPDVADRLTVVALHEACGSSRVGQAPFLPTGAPAWVEAASKYLAADQISAPL